jgi:predicted dehydrogenase
MTPLRIAIVGAGDFAHEHARSIAALPQFARLVAAVDPTRERARAFCTAHGIPAAYADTSEMLRQEHPDIVAICSPPHTHAPLTLEALRAGAHVVCEKPLALSLAELDEIAAAEDETARTCTGIMQWRYGAGAQHVKRLLTPDEFGAPLLALCNTLWYRGAEYYAAAPWRAEWDKAGGGVAMTMGIHAMDMVLWLLGEWTEVSAITSSLDRAVTIDTLALAQVRFANGALASFVNSTLSPRQASSVRIDMQRATIELTHLYRYENRDWHISLRTDTPPDDAAYANLVRWRQIETDEPGSIETQYAHILPLLRTGKRTPTRPHALRPTYEFLAALYKSAATGQPVKRGTILPGDPFYASMNPK